MTDLVPELAPSHGVDVPLLRKTLEFITDNPDQHRQDVWAKRTECGTAMCLAGWAVTFAGLDIDFDSSMAHVVGAWNLTDGRPIADAAAELLGVEKIDDDNVDTWEDHIFNENNTLADLWRIAAELTDGEIEVPAQFTNGADTDD